LSLTELPVVRHPKQTSTAASLRDATEYDRRMTSMKPIDTEHINILLEEYKTLRAEIISRTTNGYQLLAFGAALPAALFALVGPSRSAWQIWIGLGFLVVVVLSLCGAMYYDIFRAADWLIKVEAAINLKAGGDLLTWETHGGGGLISRIRREFRKGLLWSKSPLPTKRA
jgi:hypothetical protein